MNLATALRNLSAATDHVPVDTIEWLLANWDKASTASLQVLARCARDPEGSPDGDLAAAYFLLHVCAEQGETRAFPLLCSLAKDPAGIDDILGDALLIVLAPIVISIFDGKTEALLSVLDAPDASLETKAGLFGALAYLTAAGRTERDEIEAYLESFPQRAANNPLAGWDGWAMAIALIGSDRLMPLVRQAYEREDLAELLPDLREVEDVLQIAREEKDPLTVFDREGLRPIEDALGTLAATENELQELMEEQAREDARGGAPEDDEAPATAQAVNEFRDVGRNDPCPCGSGKKFKKCCSAAA